MGYKGGKRMKLYLKGDKLYRLGLFNWLTFVNYKHNLHLYNEYEIEEIKQNE